MQDMTTIQPRMPHVATLVPDAMKAMYAFSRSAGGALRSPPRAARTSRCTSE